MKWIRFVLLSGFFILFFCNSNAQDNLRGVVVEENEKGILSPIIGANVYWQGTTIGAATDTSGTFVIPFEAEYRNLIISYIGYKADTIVIENPKKLTVILKNSQDLDEVQVVYRRKTTEISFMDPIKTEILGEQELFKAACCNLSESFETSPSVDVSFTDALTGTRQIQMLGLAGQYTQISQENMPSVRGLAAIYGLGYIPGTWMSSIQVTKGMGPVINGYESIAGQINVELKKPEDEEKFFLNIYGNESGRAELNLNFSQKVTEKWSTLVLLHGKNQSFKQDNNGDSFLDVPLGNSLIAMNRWKFNNQKGLVMQYGVKGILIDNKSGQLDAIPAGYAVQIETERFEGFSKIGYVFPKKKYNSVGLQQSVISHRQNSYFGLRKYNGEQQTYYANLIYQSIIGNTNHKTKVGLSYMYDNYNEDLDSANFRRTESVPGAFLEYTFLGIDNYTLVLGIRGDYHNTYGAFASPRVHMRYALTEKTVLRASAGRGLKTANIIGENIGILASSRQIIIDGDSTKTGFGLEPEVAWNYGINLTQEFTLDYRDGNISFDFYRTDFENQVVIDLDENPQEAHFYNLDGLSFSNSFQAQINYELIRKLDVRLAYRWFEVKTQYGNNLDRKPLIAEHRAFLNLAYETKSEWVFDYTIQWQGQKRIPGTESNPEKYQLASSSPDFIMMNAQITKKFKKKLDVYVGAENLTNFKQNDPILAVDDPFGPYFDSSLIWGPIFGRMVYGGLRYKI